MLIVFDVDGTLVEGDDVDWRAFNEALGEIVGTQPTESFYDVAPEMTAQALAESFLQSQGRASDSETLETIRASYR